MADTTPDALNSNIPKYPFLKAEQEAGERAAEAKVVAESQEKAATAGAKAKVLSESAEAERAKYDEIRGQLKPTPEFKPTQENALDLGAIFSMIGTMGVALGGSGKLSGMNALNAMNGMLQGYQQGRKDLFEKERSIFDKEMASMKAHNDALLKDLEQYQKLFAVDREAAMAKEAEIIAKNPGIIAENIKAGKLQVAYDVAKSNTKLYTEIMAKATKNGVGKTSDRYGFAEIMSVASNEAAATMQNIMGLPMESTSGIFGGRTTNSLFTAPVDAFANKLTTESTQRYNVQSGKLAYFLAQLIKGGRVVGVQEVSVMDNILKIKEGDSLETAANKLAEARQVAERAMEVRIRSENTPESLKEIYRENLDTVRTVIPFTVNDVNKFIQERDKSTTFGDELRNKYTAPTPVAVPASSAPVATPTPAAPAATKPTLQEFLEKARKSNPGATDDELTEFYNKKYGTR